MLLAIAAFLLHTSGIPQSSRVDDARSLSETITEQSRPPADSITEPAADETAPDVRSGPAVIFYGALQARDRSSVVAFEPGRLVPEPVKLANRPLLDVSNLSTGLDREAFIRDAQPAAELVESNIRSEQRRRYEWIALSLVQHGAATFDAWATRTAVSNGHRELNPMLRPFAGNASLYAAIQVGPAVLDYAGRRMMTSRRGWVRNAWWLPQALGTAMSLTSGAHDLSVSSAP